MSHHLNKDAQIESLERYCSSESLSLDGIKCALGFFVNHDFLSDSSFLHQVCANSKVTLEIIEYLVGLYPDALRFRLHGCTVTDFENAYPLHMACTNQDCPNSVLKFLMEHYCSSPDLCYAGIKRAMETVVNPEALIGSTFLHRVVFNRKVTLEIVEYLVGADPDAPHEKCDIAGMPAFSMIKAADAYPLHIACLNHHCPSSVIKFLMKRNCTTIRQSCLVSHNRRVNGWPEFSFKGLPLHFYLFRVENIQIDVVKHMVQAYHGALSMGGNDDIKATPILLAIRNPKIGAMLDVVKYLVDSKPSSLELANNKGQYSLHLAFENANTTVEIVQYLVDKSPAIASQTDKSNRLPLHYLCSHSLPEQTFIGILSIMLDVYPAGASHRDLQGELPIHRAASNNRRRAEFCKKLIDAYPVSITQLSEDGDSPLHQACWKGHISSVKYLYEVNPEMIRKGDEEYPLHCACYNTNPEVFKFVYELYPDIITVRAYGNLPIHVALSCDNFPWDHTIDIINFIVKYDPDCVSKPDGEGRLPLHLACDSSVYDLIELLYDLYPEAILIRIDNARGQLPIEIIQDLDGDKEELIAFVGTQQNYARMATQNIQALATLDSNGWLPLHHALNINAPLGSIKLLVKGNPDAINVANNDDLLPLQMSCESCSVGVVKFLANFTEDSFSLRDANGNYLLHSACRGGNADVVMYLLDSGHLKAVTEKNKDGMIPIRLFNEFVRQRQFEFGANNIKYVETIWHLLMADPETLDSSNWIDNESHNNT